MYFQQIDKNDKRLIEFINECKVRNYNNNVSIKDMKFDYFEHSAFFAGIHDGKIKTFSGVHNFDFDGKRFWRVAFRAVSLYDSYFKPKLSNNWRISSIHMGVGITLEMKWVEKQFGPSKFVITSNDYNNSVEKSGNGHGVDKLFKSNKISGVSLLYSNITYLNTVQNVWVLDQSKWYNDYDLHYSEVQIK